MKSITVPQDVVNKVQFADYRVRGLQISASGLLESHLKDESTEIVESPIFKVLQDELGKAAAHFEMCKDEMLHSVLTEEEYTKLGDWNLTYASCKLLYDTI